MGNRSSNCSTVPVTTGLPQAAGPALPCPAHDPCHDPAPSPPHKMAIVSGVKSGPAAGSLLNTCQPGINMSLFSPVNHLRDLDMYMLKMTVYIPDEDMNDVQNIRSMMINMLLLQMRCKRGHILFLFTADDKRQSQRSDRKYFFSLDEFQHCAPISVVF